MKNYKKIFNIKNNKKKFNLKKKNYKKKFNLKNKELLKDNQYQKQLNKKLDFFYTKIKQKMYKMNNNY